MARSRIAGITIQLGADTSKLTTALKGVNSTITQSSNALKDINKQLKFDPKNTELLKQKQEYLNTEIQATKEKLEQEKAAMEQLKEAGKTTDNQEQQKALAREIAETERNLKNLEEESKNFGSVFKQQMIASGEQVKELGTKITTVGKGMTKYITGPLVAVGAASVKAFNEVDEGMDTVTQKTGATGKALEGLQDVMKNVATRVPTDFATAGEAVGEINTRFGLTGQALEDLATQFVQFADLNDTDVSSSIDSVQKVMAAFNVDVKDAGALLDTMNAVGQNTGLGMDTLSSSMVTNAAALTELGFNAADAANFLGQVETSGVDLTQVMTGLKTGIKNAAKEGKDLPTALADFQKTMQSSASDTDKLNAAVDLFGGRAGPAMYKAAKDGSLSFEDLGKSIQDNLGNVGQTFENTMDPTDRMKQSMNNLKLAGADLAASLFEVLGPILEDIAKIVKTVTEKLDGMDPSQKNMIVTIGLVVAAIGPLLVVIGTIISSIGSIMTLLPLLAGPVGIVIAAIGGLIAWGVLLYKNWDEIKLTGKAVVQSLKDAWTSFKDTMSNVWDSVVDKVERAKDAVKRAVDAIVQWLQNIPVVGGIFDFLGSSSSATKGGGRSSKKKVKWHASAMNDPYIFTQPTVFGSGGQLHGAGEAGAEILMGLNRYRSDLAAAAASGDQNVFNVSVNVATQPGQNNEQIGKTVSRYIANDIDRRFKAYA